MSLNGEFTGKEIMLVKISDARDQAEAGTLTAGVLNQVHADLDAYIDEVMDSIGPRIQEGGFQAAADGYAELAEVAAAGIGLLELVRDRIPAGGPAPAEVADVLSGYTELRAMATGQGHMQTSLARLTAGSLDEAETAIAKAEEALAPLAAEDSEYDYLLAIARCQRFQIAGQKLTRRFKAQAAAEAYSKAASCAEAAYEAAEGNEALQAQAQVMIATSRESAERGLMRAAMSEGDFKAALTHAQAILAGPAAPATPDAPAWATALLDFQRGADEAYAANISAEVYADEKEWDRALDELNDSERLWRRAMSKAFEVSPELGHIGESMQGFAFQMMTTTRQRVDRERGLQRTISELRAENERLKAATGRGGPEAPGRPADDERLH